jgi:DNA recombination protein RmuC
MLTQTNSLIIALLAIIVCIILAAICIYLFNILKGNSNKTLEDLRNQMTLLLTNNTDSLAQRFETLTHTTNSQLKEISGQVEKRLFEGFEKTTATFTDVVKRLALIDEAQKRITELSSNVMSLQEILTDKRSRGAFGEVQLEALIRNVIPQDNFKFQYQLSNDTRVDCILFLPNPTGNVAIDAKFPLENYRHMTNPELSTTERKIAEQQFRIDIKRHMQNIADKYIIPNETSDGALMFIPAEAIFAEIHANHPDLIDLSHQLKVWLVSPTTMMAILTTARAVLKDVATKKQMHVIQKHLMMLGKDFSRFQERMEKLASHINLAHDALETVHQSAKKISSRFTSIEKVEVELLEDALENQDVD